MGKGFLVSLGQHQVKFCNCRMMSEIGHVRWFSHQQMRGDGYGLRGRACQALQRTRNAAVAASVKMKVDCQQTATFQDCSMISSPSRPTMHSNRESEDIDYHGHLKKERSVEAPRTLQEVLHSRERK